MVNAAHLMPSPGSQNVSAKLYIIVSVHEKQWLMQHTSCPPGSQNVSAKLYIIVSVHEWQWLMQHTSCPVQAHRMCQLNCILLCLFMRSSG